MLPVSREVALFPEHRFAISQPRGGVTGEVLETYGRAMAYHPDWEPGFTEVWDLTFSPSLDVVPSDIERMKQLERETAEQLEGSRTIIVTDRPAILFAAKFYARLMQAFGRDVVSVSTREAAADLLGIGELPVLGAG